MKTMISLKIAFDENDKTLGSYFKLSKLDLVEFLNDYDPIYHVEGINSGGCNQTNVEAIISRLNGNSFLFVAYTHGNDDALVVDGHAFIETNANTTLFRNSIFYSMACSNGRGLGEDLIRNGCHAFIGYDTVSTVFLDGKQKISVNCDNSGIKSFILGKTIRESVESMKSYYDSEINKMIRFGDIISAGILRNNKNSLVFFGKPEFKVNDLT
jgi:hypothetical protein